MPLRAGRPLFSWAIMRSSVEPQPPCLNLVTLDVFGFNLRLPPLQLNLNLEQLSMGDRRCPLCSSKTDEPICSKDGAQTLLEEKPSEIDATDLLLGRVFEGRYRVDSRLGAGGMGTVYRARQIAVNRDVALKVLHGRCAQDQRDIARFQQEARAVASLRHPNTVSLIDYGETRDGIFYLVMELVEGVTLRDVIAKDGPLEASRAIHIASQIAESLAEAHECGIVHRDLKPSNVLLTDLVGRADFVKVVDFGIARVRGPAAAPIRLTGTGLAIGSPRFMSPEQVSALDVGPRSDLYALGVLLYEMLTGGPLFEHAEPTQVLIAHLQEEPSWPTVGGAPLRGQAAALCMQCLSKLPSDRPQDALEVLSRLELAAAEALIESTARDDSPRGGRRGSLGRLEEPVREALPGEARGAADATTRPDRAHAGPVERSLPGHHLAVCSSPTIHSAVPASERAPEVQEVATLLRGLPVPSKREQLQTGILEDTSPGRPRREANSASTSGRLGWLGGWSLAVALIAMLPSGAEEPSPTRAPLEVIQESAEEPREGAHPPSFSEAPPEGNGAPQADGEGRGFLLRSTPEGALVFADGEPIGTTPLWVSSARRDELLELELAGHLRASVAPERAHASGEVIVRMRARD